MRRRRIFFLYSTLAATGPLSLAGCGGSPGPASPAPASPTPSSRTTPSPAPPALSPLPAPPEYDLDFSGATIEDPLSAGGLSNNAQGVGGDQPPPNMTGMRFDFASDRATRIAMATHGGIGYDDSFAFVSGFGGNQWCEAVPYKEGTHDKFGFRRVAMGSL